MMGEKDNNEKNTNHISLLLDLVTCPEQPKRQLYMSILKLVCSRITTPQHDHKYVDCNLLLIAFK
jgi:hypothetical protein